MRRCSDGRSKLWRGSPQAKWGALLSLVGLPPHIGICVPWHGAAAVTFCCLRRAETSLVRNVTACVARYRSNCSAGSETLARPKVSETSKPARTTIRFSETFPSAFRALQKGKHILERLVSARDAGELGASKSFSENRDETLACRKHLVLVSRRNHSDPWLSQRERQAM